jgi:hypothetical protein
MVKKYGFMRDVEEDLIDQILEQLSAEFRDIRFLEIGVMGGETVRGVYKTAERISCPVFGAGVDFEMYRPNPTPASNYKFYSGDSMDAWRGIQHQFNFLFVDGCHCVNHTMCDFLNYSPFVVPGGYCLFHDTALPIGGKYQEEFPQNHSYAGQPDSTLGVRQGLEKLGLLQGYRTDWKLIEEVPSDSGLMGMMLFQNI